MTTWPASFDRAPYFAAFGRQFVDREREPQRLLRCEDEVRARPRDAILHDAMRLDGGRDDVVDVGLGEVRTGEDVLCPAEADRRWLTAARPSSIDFAWRSVCVTMACTIANAFFMRWASSCASTARASSAALSSVTSREIDRIRSGVHRPQRWRDLDVPVASAALHRIGITLEGGGHPRPCRGDSLLRGKVARALQKSGQGHPAMAPKSETSMTRCPLAHEDELGVEVEHLDAIVGRDEHVAHEGLALAQLFQGAMPAVQSEVTLSSPMTSPCSSRRGE